MRFLAGRLAQSLIVLSVMSFAIYGLIGLMPGDPIDLMISANPELTPEDAKRLKALHGLDRPFLARYGAWLQAALGGDFGFSRLFGKPVGQILWPRLANTVALMGAAFLLSVAIAVPAGILAALNPRGRIDYLVNLLCFAGISMPPFWLALLLIMLFAVQLGILPASALPTASDPGLLERLRHIALPVLTLALLGVGGTARYVRAALGETLRQDFIRTARAKGVGPARLVRAHALPNAMLPVITILALDVGALFSGALITETMFAYPGMGKLIYDAIMGSDFNLALAGLLFATMVTLASNFAADAAYAGLDPRITFAGAVDRRTDRR